VGVHGSVARKASARRVPALDRAERECFERQCVGAMIERESADGVRDLVRDLVRDAVIGLRFGALRRGGLFRRGRPEPVRRETFAAVRRGAPFGVDPVAEEAPGTGVPGALATPVESPRAAKNPACANALVARVHRISPEAGERAGAGRWPGSRWPRTPAAGSSSASGPRSPMRRRRRGCGFRQRSDPRGCSGCCGRPS